MPGRSLKLPSLSFISSSAIPQMVEIPSFTRKYRWRRLCQVFATIRIVHDVHRAAAILHRTIAPKKEGQRTMLRCARTGESVRISGFWDLGKVAQRPRKSRFKFGQEHRLRSRPYRNTGSDMIAADSWISVWRKIQQPRQLIIRTHHTSLCPALLVRRADQPNAFQQ